MNQASETNFYKDSMTQFQPQGVGEGRDLQEECSKCSKETGWSKSAEKNQAEE